MKRNHFKKYLHVLVDDAHPYGQHFVVAVVVVVVGEGNLGFQNHIEVRLGEQRVFRDH